MNEEEPVGEIEQQAGVDAMVVIRPTGEIIDLRVPEEVARAYASVEELGRQVAEAKRILSQALVDYSLVRGERTFMIPNHGKWVREGGPAKEKTYDPRVVEKGLREAGMPEDRIREIVVETVDRKVNGVEANKAARSNPAYAEAIEAGTTKVDQPYRVGRAR